jgi:hypothetical protein
MRVAASFVAVSVLGLLIGSCAPDLGACDMNAATQLVYSTAGTPYYTGQAVVQQSCSGGLCHASSAVGDARVGAPHGLDFDVAPLTSQSTPTDTSALQAGISKVRDKAHNMWGQIENGNMPPGTVGQRPVQTWKLPNGNPTQALDINTADGKATVRNWLACNAPIVGGATGAPAEAAALGAVLPPMSSSAATNSFQYIYDNILSGTCKSCHVKGSPYASMTPMDFTTVTTAYASLNNQDASATGKCVGHGKLVVAGNCDTSLLYLKLAPAAPAVCGDLMPLAGTPISTTLRQNLCDWIKAGALP